MHNLLTTRPFWILVGLAAGYCGPATLPGDAADGNAADGGEREGAEAGNRFAMDLYGRLAKEKGNHFLSPCSIHTALVMAWTGARGGTAGEMAKVLHLEAGPQAHRHSAALMKALETGARQGDAVLYRLVVANALWGQKGYPFKQAFLDLLRADYGGALEAVDFEAATEAARKVINSWVESRTEQKVRELVPRGILTPLTRLVLTNAIYFKSAWEAPFSNPATKNAPFHLGAGEAVSVPLMHQVKSFSYFEDEGLQIVEIPYKGHALAMVIFLPREGSSLPSLEEKLGPESLGRWLGGLKTRRVDLSLPRFKTTSAFKMRETLSAMGMSAAFSDGADFSGIDGTRDLHIQEVLHKAFVEVDEEGTEAAAATAVLMKRKALAPPEEEPVVFRADRPFLYMIRHLSSGAILFLGRLADPQ